MGGSQFKCPGPPTSFAAVLNTCLDQSYTKSRREKVKGKAALNLGNASKSWSSGNMADWLGSLENMKCSITAWWWKGHWWRALSVRTVWKRKERKLHTIFLMLLRLKLPALRCFCTWLADPWRVRPLLQCPVVGESSTFSLSIPGEKQSGKLLPFLCVKSWGNLMIWTGAITWWLVLYILFKGSTGRMDSKTLPHRKSHHVK